MPIGAHEEQPRFILGSVNLVQPSLLRGDDVHGDVHRVAAEHFVHRQPVGVERGVWLEALEQEQVVTGALK